MTVVYAIAEGLTAQEVGQRLGISEQTVKNHLHSVNLKLGTESRIELLHAFGWVTLPRAVVSTARETWTEAA
jgi:DNA-binding CsgD family transcriptional regulator